MHVREIVEVGNVPTSLNSLLGKTPALICAFALHNGLKIDKISAMNYVCNYI